MIVIKCPECGGEVQATRKTYYSFSNASGRWNEGPSGEDWHIYCENDHELGTLEPLTTAGPNRRELADLIEEYGHE